MSPWGWTSAKEVGWRERSVPATVLHPNKKPAKRKRPGRVLSDQTKSGAVPTHLSSARVANIQTCDMLVAGSGSFSPSRTLRGADLAPVAIFVVVADFRGGESVGEASFVGNEEEREVDDLREEVGIYPVSQIRYSFHRYTRTPTKHLPPSLSRSRSSASRRASSRRSTCARSVGSSKAE